MQVISRISDGFRFLVCLPILVPVLVLDWLCKDDDKTIAQAMTELLNALDGVFQSIWESFELGRQDIPRVFLFLVQVSLVMIALCLFGVIP